MSAPGERKPSGYRLPDSHSLHSLFITRRLHLVIPAVEEAFECVRQAKLLKRDNPQWGTSNGWIDVSTVLANEVTRLRQRLAATPEFTIDAIDVEFRIIETNVELHRGRYDDCKACQGRPA